MARITGTGSYLPKRIVTNKEMEEYVDTTDEWIVSRTGIKERHISDENENTGDLGYEAARAALDDAGIKAEEVDYILVATTTPHSLVPNTSSYIQNKLGAVNAACLDLNAACTGFIYGLEVAEGLLKSDHIHHILVIGSEVLTKITDFTDRSTCVLFGDGAGAAVLSKGDGIRGIVTGADGSRGACLSTGDFPVNNILQKGASTPQLVHMDGKEVYKFAVNILPESLKEAVERGNGNIDELDHIVPHQANIRIIEAASKRLNISMDKFFVNIHNTGNTSSASIAIALDELNRSSKLKNGDQLALVGFGGGLTYGAVYLEWNK